MSNRKETRMAQIPYGYRIERGRIAVDTEAAAEISRFVESYLSGLSVKESKKAAKIPLSESTLNQLLKTESVALDQYVVSCQLRNLSTFVMADHGHPMNFGV